MQILNKDPKRRKFKTTIKDWSQKKFSALKAVSFKLPFYEFPALFLSILFVSALFQEDRLSNLHFIYFVLLFNFSLRVIREIVKKSYSFVHFCREVIIIETFTVYKKNQWTKLKKIITKQRTHLPTYLVFR